MYCMNLKKRKNKPFCKNKNKEIELNECSNCPYKKYKELNRTHQLKSKTKKLAKIERNRTSVFTNDLKHCYLCSNKKDDLHEIFSGRNRLNSIKYGLILPLCRECHSKNQNNADFNDFWHKQGQLYFEKNIGSREEFIKIFKRNYLD